MALSGVKYFNAVSSSKRFLVHQYAEEKKIKLLQKRMMCRVWKEKEELLNEFIQINVKTPTESNYSRHIELKQMAVDPRLVLPLDSRTRSMKHQTVIVPVITIDGRSATLYPKKGAKHGRNVALSSKVYERMHKAKNISTTLESISSKESKRKNIPENIKSDSCSEMRVSFAPTPQTRFPKIETPCTQEMFQRKREHRGVFVTKERRTKSAPVFVSQERQ